MGQNLFLYSQKSHCLWLILQYIGLWSGQVHKFGIYLNITSQSSHSALYIQLIQPYIQLYNFHYVFLSPNAQLFAKRRDATSAVLDVIIGSNFKSWSTWHSDTEQNYLGVLGIIWTAGWDFPIIGSCDTVPLLVCRQNDFQWWLKIGNWKVVYTLFASLSAITTIQLLIFPSISYHILVIFCHAKRAVVYPLSKVFNFLFEN